MSNSLKVPKHLGIIVDGNRRWARERRMPPWKGHWEGVKNLEKILECCLKLKIREVSIYALSTENLKRPKIELDELFKIFYHYLNKWEKEDSFLRKYQVKVRFIGDLEKLPPKLVNAMGRLMQKTAKYQKRVLNLLIAYGSKFEITQAVKKLAETLIKLGKIEITPKDIEKNLMITTPLDLVIRTGGYSRLSNFLLWQASYAEIYVTDTLWPTFTKREFMKAIRWYSSVKRNFGA
ncbi:MAG: polyprenyl diphosphate synthase [Candidatus Aenigmatarchaeota archaeon]|nr:di-trans,poly-cis-decaprenylcistransferase [Candidatus Aenigmarchaeota archaeon]